MIIIQLLKDTKCSANHQTIIDNSLDNYAIAKDFFSALPPFVGEVVLRGTLSHRPALRCAAHGAEAPLDVDDTS